MPSLSLRCGSVVRAPDSGNKCSGSIPHHTQPYIRLFSIYDKIRSSHSLWTLKYIQRILQIHRKNEDYKDKPEEARKNYLRKPGRITGGSQKGLPEEDRKECLRKTGRNTRGRQEGIPKEARKEYLRKSGCNYLRKPGRM